VPLRINGQARECHDLHRVAGFLLSKNEPVTQEFSRDIERTANGVCFAALLSFRRKDRDDSASLAVTQEDGGRRAGAGRKAHWASMLNSVPDFTLWVKLKSRPGGGRAVSVQ
jgi:hypothetical protein